jgi:hypothetical protein
MKLSLLTVLLFIALSSCNSLMHRDTVKDFIPGRYVQVFHQEYSKGRDTLVISSLNDASGTFRMERHITYTPIHDGKLLPEEHHEETWIALYNEATKQLLEQRWGKIFSFSPESRCLYLGSTKYDKVGNQ